MPEANDEKSETRYHSLLGKKLIDIVPPDSTTWLIPLEIENNFKTLERA